MCDYNALSRTTLSNLKRPVHELAIEAGEQAWQPLCRIGTSGRLRAGYDFTDGTPLDAAAMRRGHYLRPENFIRALAEMARHPHRCAWCGGRLSDSLVRQHAAPHDHRELITHHFHPACWTVRLIAVAVVFGHLPVTAVLAAAKRPAFVKRATKPSSRITMSGAVRIFSSRREHR